PQANASALRRGLRRARDGVTLNGGGAALAVPARGGAPGAPRPRAARGRAAGALSGRRGGGSERGRGGEGRRGRWGPRGRPAAWRRRPRSARLGPSRSAPRGSARPPVWARAARPQRRPGQTGRCARRGGRSAVGGASCAARGWSSG
ncbi:hypothetical protein FVP46_03390, partial [Mycobacterium tuberculosis]|nr:hypothetical protein [Mycobacterium tuberculosis]